MAWNGIDVRHSGDRIVFRALLQDSTGAIVTTGTTTVRLYEVQSDATLKSYDFNDNTFKTTALTTETLALTHRAGNNATTNTGLWTAALTTVSGFTAGNLYIAQVSNSGASPAIQAREFQYGGAEGDTAAQSGDSYAVVNDSAFGNAKLVRATTPANTLDVAATGEAGLDFNNVKQATGATILTNITIPIVTSTGSVSGNVLGNVAGTVGQVSSLASFAISDTTFTSDALAAIAASIWGDVEEGVIVAAVAAALDAMISSGAFTGAALANAWAKAGSDPTAVPASTATVLAKLDFLCALARNKLITDEDTITLRNDGDTADIGVAPFTETAGTFTRDEFS